MLSATALKGNLNLSLAYKLANLNPVWYCGHSVLSYTRDVNAHWTEAVKKASLKATLLSLQVVWAGHLRAIPCYQLSQTGSIKPPAGFATSSYHRAVILFVPAAWLSLTAPTVNWLDKTSYWFLNARICVQSSCFFDKNLNLQSATYFWPFFFQFKFSAEWLSPPIFKSISL